MVSGDSDEIGTITQWSKGANRIFGYESHEIVGKSVELLMPTVYARHHTKVLRNAISRGPEHIPNKERFVFALNKSGYIFPVFIQLKLIQKKEQPT
jgi:PAS domain S-box-containing protein